MELGNYKIKVTTEAESREAQELFFELGYKWHGCGKRYSGIGRYTFITAYPDEMTLRMGWGGDTEKETTLAKLRDLVVLHRNDVNDANYTYSGKPVLKLDTQDYKVWDSKNNTWTEHVGSQTDLRKGIEPIQPEQCLISGADALRALADGKEVEFFYRDVWDSIGEMIVIDHFMSDKFKFRLKPQTITLSLEIPAPFEPKVGDTAYFLSTSNAYGYSYTNDFKGYGFDSLIQFGAWRTEEEIKQVVAALRGALKNG